MVVVVVGSASEQGAAAQGVAWLVDLWRVAGEEEEESTPRGG